MRLRRLHIPAFGPFTDLDLSFPVAGPDLQVIYGANEAGKSCLLRAIRDLLFGIHPQSTDNFVHDYKMLRLGAEIENREGQRLSFSRRKGNKNTLLDEAGNPLPDTALGPFLGTVDSSYFSTMFGLGSSELRDGAEQLLHGEGEIGTALFSASLGGTPIQRVVGALIEESERLFKGRALASVSIRPAANRYKEFVKQSRESAVPADVWQQLEEGIEHLQAERETLENEIGGCEGQLTWLARCEDALPMIGRYNSESKLLGELPKLPDVAGDFVERAKIVRDAASAAARKVELLIAQIAQLKTKLDQRTTFPEVLAAASELDGLHQELGAYRDRKERWTTLQGKLAGIKPGLLGEMKSLGVDGGLESLERLRLSSATRLRLEDAAGRLAAALRQSAEGVKKAATLRDEIETHRRDLQLLAEIDLEPLRGAWAIAADATEASKTLEVSRAAVETLTRQMQDDLAMIPGAPSDPDSAARLPVPSAATIRKFRERFAELERGEKAAGKRIREEEARITKLREELVRLGRRGELPTEEALKEARQRRDYGWQLVLKDWKGSGPEGKLDPVQPLEEAFPKTIQIADEIADRLRTEADAVAQAEEKRLQILGCENAVEAARAEMDAHRNAARECRDSWSSEWRAAGIQPHSPEEMEEWREAWTGFRETLGKLREAEETFRSKIQQIQKSTAVLAAALNDSPAKSFALLFEAGRKRLQQGEESTGRRKQIADQLEKAQKDLAALSREADRLSQEVEAAEAVWHAESQAAGLPAGISAEAGRALLQERKELIAKFDRWKEWSGEASLTEEALKAYEQRVSEWAGQFGQSGWDTPEAREAALWKMLQEARAAQTEYDHRVSQVEDAQGNLALAQQEESRSRLALDDLMRIAGIHSTEELEPLLAALERRAAIRSRLDEFRALLGGLARGATVEDFMARVEAENAEELPQRKSSLEARKAEKKTELQSIRDRLAESNRHRAELAKAGGTAADYRQQAEWAAATLTQDASRFVRLRLAAHILRGHIEQFRQQNQGPLLEKAGEIFRRITRSSFDGLAAEFNAEDVPVLMGRRARGTNVPVAGMSEGTRDQLYLALRLAALERHLENHEPMPFILDDLLITFDNARSAAILPELAELAKRTQIFLFTHHEHLVELCRRHWGEGNFHLHSLDDGARKVSTDHSGN